MMRCGNWNCPESEVGQLLAVDFMVDTAALFVVPGLWLDAANVLRIVEIGTAVETVKLVLVSWPGR